MDTTWLAILAVIAAYAAYKYLTSGGEVISQKKRELGEYTRKDVAQHNSRDSLWLILKRETGFFVYDVTSYIDAPGGDATKP
jgi:cytochrome b involved in lipid metabolism